MGLTVNWAHGHCAVCGKEIKFMNVMWCDDCLDEFSDCRKADPDLTAQKFREERCR